VSGCLVPQQAPFGAGIMMHGKSTAPGEHRT